MTQNEKETFRAHNPKVKGSSPFPATTVISRAYDANRKPFLVCYIRSDY